MPLSYTSRIRKPCKIDVQFTLELAMSKSFAQCDCCDYFTIPDGNDYEVCPVCFWEQDAFGVFEPDEPSGSNRDQSVREGRKNFLLFGACAAEFKANVVVFLSARNIAMSHAPSSSNPALKRTVKSCACAARLAPRYVS